MTGRTHDLAAFTALTMTIAFLAPLHLSLGTAVVSFGSNMVGGLIPDIDQSSAKLYSDIRGGHILAKVIDPLLGGHRFLSHSILGAVLFGFLAKLLLTSMDKVVLVDMHIVWWSFMIGFISHLIMDTLTKEGVPWLFPIPIRFGFPPFRILRVTTGGFFEKSVIFPSLIIVNIYFFYVYYAKFLAFFKSFF